MLNILLSIVLVALIGWVLALMFQFLDALENLLDITKDFEQITREMANPIYVVPAEKVKYVPLKETTGSIYLPPANEDAQLREETALKRKKTKHEES